MLCLQNLLFIRTNRISFDLTWKQPMVK